MTRGKWGAAGAIAVMTLAPVLGAAFLSLGDVAPIGDLEAEAGRQAKTLESLLKDNASFEEMTNRKKRIPRAAGVLAVLGQAISEHPDKTKAKIAGPELRDASRRVIASKSYEDAVVALSEVKAALEGKKTGNAETEHAWNKLMSLHRLMEEVEDRHSELREVFVKAQRGRKITDADAVAASTLAVLALAVHADNHEVKNPNEIPEWETLSKEFQQRLTDLSKAIHQGDANAIKGIFPKTTQSCADCHEKFRH